MHEKVERLTKDLANFVQGRYNLDKLLSQQRCRFNKAGLGYEEDEKIKYYKNLFDKSKDKIKQRIQEKPPMHPTKKKNNVTKIKSNQICYNCRKKGHISNVCPYYWKLISDKYYLVALYSNTTGSKKIWIPKSQNSLSAALPEVYEARGRHLVSRQ